MADYLKKIKDCLALAESPNEHEARAALLKARELMAKHKVSEQELNGTKEQEVVRKKTGIDYSPRRDPWVYELAGVIALHHCCRNAQIREKGRQVAEILFIGFEEDVAVCIDVFRYAVDCVRSMTKRLKKDKSVKAADGYGFGFAVGLKEAYDKQSEEGWGLVLVVPEAVDASMKGMKKKSNPSQSKLNESDSRMFIKGVQDGRKFHEQKRLSGGVPS